MGHLSGVVSKKLKADEEVKRLKEENTELRREVETLDSLICSIHEDLFLRQSDDGVVNISDWIWQRIKSIKGE